MDPKRELIVQTAIKLFSRHGYENIGMDEIAFEANISGQALREYYPEQEELYDEIIDLLPEIMLHYEPTESDIDDMLAAGEGPGSILYRFVRYYDIKNEPLFQKIYRFAFVEQHRNRAIRSLLYDTVIHPARHNCARVMGLLSDKGLIPAGDHEALADVWNRTSLMYERLFSDNSLYVDGNEYIGLAHFFIDLAVNGFEPVDIDGLQPLPMADARLEAKGVRQEVQTTALDLFERHGYMGVSMPEISRALNMPMSRLYTLYANKSDIVNDAMLAVQARREYGENKVFSTALDMDSREAVLYLSDAYSALRDPMTLRLHKVLYSEQFVSEDLGDIVAGSLMREVEAITQTLDRLYMEGTIARCESRKLAITLVYTMAFYNSWDTVFGQENYENRQMDRLRAIALVLGQIKRKGYVTICV